MFARELSAQSTVQLDKFAVSSADMDFVLVITMYSDDEFLAALSDNSHSCLLLRL